MSTEEATFLYRFYSADGTLLYVGITMDPGTRFATHRGDKSWWTQVATIKQKVYQTRAAALAAESTAIAEESPLYNIAQTSVPRRTPEPQFEAADLSAYWTIREAAKHAKVAERTIRRWIANGELRAYRQGARLIRIWPDDLEALRRPVTMARAR